MAKLNLPDQYTTARGPRTTPRHRPASRIRRTLLAAAATFAATLGAQAPAANGEFPRLAHYLTGPAPLGDAPLQDYLAKLDWAVVNVWPGWRGSGGVTVEQALRGVKTRNPDTKLFIYVANNELHDSTDPGDAYSEVRAKVDAERWWLYSSGGAGSRVKSTWGTVHYILNTSDFSPRDSSGRNFNEWFVDWSISTYIANNPSVDGLFTDNVFWKPRVNGDWNRDGSSDGADSRTTQTVFRQGYASYFNRMKSRMPAGKMMLGNVADWPEARSAGSGIPELEGLLNGGVLEAAIGKSYSIESWGSWADLLSWYRGTLAQMGEPRLLLFEQFGRLDDYQSFRYGFTTALMDDGYFQYADINEQVKAVWFDEYDVNLGRAVSAPPAAAWSKGVYRRDFENGIALVNPKGNGAVEVDLGGEFRRIAGRQDPGVNSGQATTRVRLNDRDGIVLLRARPQARPLPPTNIAVE
jgi:hypothetical protein